MLEFLGRSSAFLPEHNSAFFIEDNSLFLIDCSMSSLQRLIHLEKTNLLSLNRINQICILVTHTHGDHISGIPMLIHYSYFVWKKAITVAAPSKEVAEDLKFLIERLDGCPSESYELVTADSISCVKNVILTHHAPALEGRCFGYNLNISGRNIVYTGDSATLEPFKKFIDNKTTLYAEASAYKSPVHMYINDVLEYLTDITEQGTEVFLMHMDDEEFIREQIKGTKIKFAPLYGGVVMSNNAEQILNNIFSMSEKLYSDMSKATRTDNSTIFEYLIELGKVLVETDRASFWKWDKVSHTLWTIAATGTDKIIIPDNTGLVGKSLAEGRMIITNDPYNDPDFNSSVDKQTGYVTKSIMTMPVANVNGEYIGAYQVINKLGGDGKFHMVDDFRRISLAALICGLALESDVFLEEAHTDKLTKLKNRMGFFNDFTKKYSEIMNDPDRHLSMFISDIDKFKSVNDTYGHNTGDEVLKQVAAIMAENCRPCDGVYRWGGEEFIMIMTDTDMAGCAENAEELRKLIEANDCVTEEYTVHHTMSFGVTEFDPSKSIEANISDADEKLYTAKESGRNRVIS